MVMVPTGIGNIQDHILNSLGWILRYTRLYGVNMFRGKIRNKKSNIVKITWVQEEVPGVEI
jgi:hypothetical protein